ncbi:hypothetical protein PoB_002829800 [Plakobranchus ocellatus]|uniref:Uncharacterized protein n=1 Tax=Plakobranchus ocellatus TaxID=259542 RepID=A0AAV4A3M2_9GAST|nr:hypothetical protein PoB_002829800 [Plakobranchus ocellatus]
MKELSRDTEEVHCCHRQLRAVLHLTLNDKDYTNTSEAWTQEFMSAFQHWEPRLTQLFTVAEGQIRLEIIQQEKISTPLIMFYLHGKGRYLFISRLLLQRLGAK